jgi:hypothetical protein
MKKITFLAVLALFGFCWNSNAQVCTGFTSTTTDTTTFIDGVSTSGAISNISNLASGLSAGRYQDNFATSAVTTFENGTFDFSVAIQGGTVGCAIWVDWNGDFTFDVATEKVFNTTAYGNGPFTGTVTVPNGTVNGDYYMRIMIDWNDANPDDNACAFQLASGRGEVEDYKVTIVDAPTDILDFYSLQFPPNGTIAIGDTFVVYAQAYEAGLTEGTNGQAPGINVWIGYSAADTDPSGSGWTWVLADFNVETGNNDNNDEYFLNLGANVTATGTVYYASRFNLNGGVFTYGGIQADGSFGGEWGDNNNISGVLTVNGPSNDDCLGAIDLTVNADYNCGIVTASSTTAATASPQPDDATGTPNNDVWFTFTATATGHRIVISDVVNVGGGTSTSTDMGMSVFDDLAGCNMIAANEVGESDPDTLNLTGLTIGNIYYVRVYGWFSSVQNNNFNICVGSPPACDIATGLNAVSAVTSSVISWTAPSSGTPTGYNWEVQLDGVAQGTTGAIDSGSTTETTDTVTALTENTAYDLFVQVDCGGDGTSVWAGPYSFTTLAPPPANDDCANAQLVVQETNIATVADATATSGTIAGATNSGLAGEPCGGFTGNANDDVWYSFVALTSIVNITYELSTGTSFDGVAQLYSGACGSLVVVSCADATVTTPPVVEEIQATGLTVGATYYTRIYQYGASSTVGKTFDLKIWSPSTLSIAEVIGNQFTYFPNPVKNSLTLRAQSNIQNVSIYNMLGQEVLRTAPNTLESEISMDQLQSGAYFVKVSINDTTETIRVIKQ